MDLEKLKHFFSRFPTLLAVVAYGGYLAYDYNDFLNSPNSRYGQKDAESKQIESQNELIKKQIKTALEFEKILEEKRNDLRSLALRLADTKAVLTEDLDIPAFLKTVVTEAKRVGLRVKSIRPTSSKDQEFYVEQNIQLSFSGVFYQLLFFLDRLSNVQKITKVGDIDIKPSGDKKKKYVLIDGNLEVTVYKYLASKADEIAKKQSEGKLVPAKDGESGAGVSSEQVGAQAVQNAKNPKGEGK